jgi:4-hydroxybenzoate polyprenyltransferase
LLLLFAQPMKLFTAFLRLIRWPNLVFILLTQVLFYYCVIIPLLNGSSSHPAALINGWQPSHFFFPPVYFWVVVMASIFVAAAGYIINDYFDLNIDRINKPSRLVVEKIIARRWAIIWHWSFSITGIALSVYAGYHLNGISAALLGLLNTGVVLLLILYSVSLKKQLLTGNIAIAALSAWTIAILFFCTAKAYTTTEYHYVFDKIRLLRITLIYSVFAFIATLVREVIKDMEDIEGDARNGCKTMPVVWGINPSKVYAGVWIVVLAGLLTILLLYTLRLGWYGGVVYVLLTLIIPLFYLLSELRKAMVVKDFHRLSTYTKMIILAGILSMVFFLVYNKTPQHIVLK